MSLFFSSFSHIFFVLMFFFSVDACDIQFFVFSYWFFEVFEEANIRPLCRKYVEKLASTRWNQIKSEYIGDV